jgi:prepilin-type N-terminal cleavage/methylation domain-containing protein
MKIHQDERGDTLLEIVIALVVIGLVFSAYFATFSTQGSASTSHRDLVTADGILRNYAEATKSAARLNCTTSTTFTTTTTSLPSGWSVSGSTNQCPVDVSHVRQVDVTVTMPNGKNRSLSVDIRCSGTSATSGSDPCTK